MLQIQWNTLFKTAKNVKRSDLKKDWVLNCGKFTDFVKSESEKALKSKKGESLRKVLKAGVSLYCCF